MDDRELSDQLSFGTTSSSEGEIPSGEAEVNGGRMKSPRQGQERCTGGRSGREAPPRFTGNAPLPAELASPRSVPKGERVRGKTGIVRKEEGKTPPLYEHGPRLSNRHRMLFKEWKKGSYPKGSFPKLPRDDRWKEAEGQPLGLTAKLSGRGCITCCCVPQAPAFTPPLWPGGEADASVSGAWCPEGGGLTVALSGCSGRAC
jgi:hypothetical protein